MCEPSCLTLCAGVERYVVSFYIELIICNLNYKFVSNIIHLQLSVSWQIFRYTHEIIIEYSYYIVENMI